MPIKQGVLAGLALVLLLTGCAASHWETATYDRFYLNRGRIKNGLELIKVIALTPEGGALSEAVGAELERHGFVIVPKASTVDMARDVDFKKISQHYIPAQRNPIEMRKLKDALRARGVDAFLVLRAHDFAPRQYLGHVFWQQAEIEVHSTTEENATLTGAISGTTFINFRKDRPSSPSEAAKEMVIRLAQGPGGI